MNWMKQPNDLDLCFILLIVLTIIPGIVWAVGDDHEVGQQFLFFMEEAYTQKQGELQLGLDSVYQTKLTTRKVESGGEIKDTTTDTWASSVELEYGITDWLEVELWIPYLHVNKTVVENDSGAIEFNWLRDGGIGDISAGIGVGILEEDADRWWQPTVSVGFEVLLPTGDYKKGLGTDSTGYELSLKASKTIPDWVFHTAIGYGLTNDAKAWEEGADEISDEQEVEGGFAAVYQPTDEIDVIGELYAAYEREKGSEGVTHATSVYLTPGFKVEVIDGLEVGLGVPLGLNDTSYDWGVFAKLIFEW